MIFRCILSLLGDSVENAVTCAQQPSHSKPVYFESCQGATCCNHDLNTLHTFAIPKLQPSHCSPHTAFSRCLLYLTDLFVLLQCPCYLQRICLYMHFHLCRTCSIVVSILTEELIEVMALNDLSKWESSGVNAVVSGSTNYRWTTSVASNKRFSTGFGLPEGHHHHWQYHWLPFAVGHGAGTVSPAQDFVPKGRIP